MDTGRVDGTLSLTLSRIDWSDETAKCAGVFRMREGAALEVEFRAHLDDQALRVIAKELLRLGVPILWASKESVGMQLAGDTLHAFSEPPVRSFGMTGEPKGADAPEAAQPLAAARVDKRRKEFWHLRKGGAGGNGNNATEEEHP